jgi:hypothetical protein
MVAFRSSSAKPNPTKLRWNTQLFILYTLTPAFVIYP